MDVEQEIQKLHDRNHKVEADKAWETSWFRRLTLAVMTYGTVYLVMWIAELNQAALGAVVPAVAYLISSLSLPPLKRWWMHRYHSQL